MRDSIDIIIQHEGVKRERMNYAWQLVSKGLKAGSVVVTLGREKRSLDQNAKLWAMLTDLSQQVHWHGRKLSPDDWKHVVTAALQQQEAVPGIHGGFVVLGCSTRRLNKQQFAELISLIDAFGQRQGVQWSARAQQVSAEYQKWLADQQTRPEQATGPDHRSTP